jgi:hypothetical protein
VGTEAGMAPVSGLRPGSRGSPPRGQPPVWWPRAPTISYPNLPGSGRFTSGPCNPFPADDGAGALPPVGRTGCRWTCWACSIAGRGCGCGRTARHSVRRGRRARPVVPALLRAVDLTACPGWWRSRRRGGRLSGPRGARGQRGAGRVRLGQRGGTRKPCQADTSRRPGASRSGLLLSPRKELERHTSTHGAPAGSSTATRR